MRGVLTRVCSTKWCAQNSPQMATMYVSSLFHFSHPFPLATADVNLSTRLMSLNSLYTINALLPSTTLPLPLHRPDCCRCHVCLHPGSQFGAVGGPDHGYTSSLSFVILRLSQPRTPVHAILLCAFCPEHSQLPNDMAARNLPDTPAWCCGQKRGRSSEYPI